jgi:hypothetical protein
VAVPLAPADRPPAGDSTGREQTRLRQSRREKIVVALTITLVTGAVIAAAWADVESRDRTKCTPLDSGNLRTYASGVLWPTRVAVGLAVLCVVPLALSLVWRTRRAIRLWSLGALPLSWIIVFAFLRTMQWCPS